MKARSGLRAMVRGGDGRERMGVGSRWNGWRWWCEHGGGDGGRWMRVEGSRG